MRQNCVRPGRAIGAFLFLLAGDSIAACGLEDQVLCAEEVRKIRACEREVEVRTFCTNSRLPSITPAMREAAKGYPELQEDYERLNACLTDGESCQAFGPETGGKEIADKHMRAKEQDPPWMEEMSDSRFLPTTTQKDPKKVRDAAAVVMRRGFARSTFDYHMIYRVFHEKEFHGSAEGVALVSKKIVDQEYAAQEKLAGILELLRKRFEKKGDTRSMQSTAIYENIARSQMAMLDAVSCELQKLATINRERQDRMRSIMGSDLASSDPGQGSLAEDSDLRRLSDISGVDGKRSGKKESAADEEGGDPGRFLATTRSHSHGNGEHSHETLQGESAELPFHGSEAGFGRPELTEDYLYSLDPASGEELDLFTRVRRKHRQKEKAGVFVRGLLD